MVGAFHHLSALTLISDADWLDHEDVLVCGDDANAKAAVLDLAATITGKPGIDAGALRLARQLEPLTAVLGEQALQGPLGHRSGGTGRTRLSQRFWSGPAAGVRDELARREAARAVEEYRTEVGVLLHRAEPLHRDLALELGPALRRLGV